MKQEEWKNKLKTRFDDYQAAAPDGLWDSIEQELDAAQGSKRHVFLLLFTKRNVAAAIGTLLLLGGITWWQLNKQAETTPMTQTVQKHKAVESLTDVTEHDIPQKPDSRLLASNHISQGKELLMDGRTKETLQIEKQPLEEASPMPLVQPEDKKETQEPAKNDEKKPSERQPVNSSSSSQQVKDVFTPTAKRRSAGQVSLGLYAANNMTEVHGSKPVRMSSEMANVFSDVSSAESYAGAKASPMFLTDTYEETEYDIPVSFGLSIGYGLTPRLSFSTGLVYTKLNSTLTQVMGNDRVMTHRTLHYVGIPLNVQYQIWGNKAFKTYLTMGGQADLNVSAKAKVNDIEQDLNKDKVQFSVNASAGIQYNITPFIGIYAEPGVKYYPKNGSELQTIYKKYPVNFNLQVGLRVNMNKE